IEQTRATTQRRDQDLSIRVKALESRIDNVLHHPRPGASEATTPLTPKTTTSNPQEARTEDSAAPESAAKSAGVENEASAFRSAYKIFLNGDYERATVEFQRFIKNYPSATLTP